MYTKAHDNEIHLNKRKNIAKESGGKTCLLLSMATAPREKALYNVGSSLSKKTYMTKPGVAKKANASNSLLSKNDHTSFEKPMLAGIHLLNQIYPVKFGFTCRFLPWAEMHWITPSLLYFTAFILYLLNFFYSTLQLKQQCWLELLRKFEGHQPTNNVAWRLG